MNRWWRGFALLAAAAVATGGLTGCGSSSGDSGGRVTINFINPEVEGSFSALIAEFEKQHPDIQVKPINVPFDQLNSTLQARLGSKDASIDVYVVDPPAIPNLVTRGFLDDISQIESDVQNASLKVAYDSNVYQGKLWAVPIWTSEQFLYYNVDLLKQAGIEPPSMDPAKRWTWEKTVAAAEAAQKAGAKWGLLFDQIDRYYQLQALAESAGGGSGLTGDKNLKADLTNPGWRKAMSWYGGLFERGVAPKGIATDQMNPLFATGKAAFFVGGPWALKQFTSEAALQFALAPHPYFEGGKPATPTDSWSWGINPASKNKAKAMEFLKFASAQTSGNLLTIDKIFIPPTNKQAFETYMKRLDESGGAATKGAGALMLSELEKTATHRPASPGYLQFETLMNSKVLPDIRNGAKADDRLGLANQELDSTFSRIK